MLVALAFLHIAAIAALAAAFVTTAFVFGMTFGLAARCGTPVAATAAVLSRPRLLAASGFSPIANTAPVAYGALGTRLVALSAVARLDLLALPLGHDRPAVAVLLAAGALPADLGLRRRPRDDGDRLRGALHRA